MTPPSTAMTDHRAPGLVCCGAGTVPSAAVYRKQIGPVHDLDSRQLPPDAGAARIARGGAANFSVDNV